MRKKILIAEESDAIRSIGESILHQHGYDVVSASSAEKAKELIVTAEPNMVIAGAGLKGDDGKFLYEQLESNPNTASLPLLLISDPENPTLPYPEEVILARPFDPNDFIERVKLFVGSGGVPDEKVEEVKNISNDSISDDFLDSTMGSDKLVVEDSEVMDQTHISQKIRQMIANKKKDVYDMHQEIENIKDEHQDSTGKVESLMIKDDTEIKAKPETKIEKTKDAAAQSDLEIANDQYGMHTPGEEEPSAPQVETEKPKKDHDYDWFLDEMQKETDASPKGKQKTPQKQDSGSIHTVDTGNSVEPVKPRQKNYQPGTGVADEPEIKSGGVDKFISDFKKEVEKIGSPPREPIVSEQTIKEPSPAETPAPTTTMEKEPIDSENMQHYITNMVEIVAEKVAKSIVEKIDKKELYKLLQDHIAQKMNKK